MPQTTTLSFATTSLVFTFCCGDAYVGTNTSSRAGDGAAQSPGTQTHTQPNNRGFRPEIATSVTVGDQISLQLTASVDSVFQLAFRLGSG